MEDLEFGFFFVMDIAFFYDPSAVNEIGTVLDVTIINHGLNYTSDLSIVASNPKCTCNHQVFKFCLTLFLSIYKDFSFAVHSLETLSE